MDVREFYPADRGQVSTLGLSLHSVCKSEYINLDDVQLLLRQGKYVNEIDESGRSPLSHVCENKAVSLAVVKELLNYGADVNQCDPGDYSVLIYACENSNCELEVIRELIRRGAIVNQQDEYLYTPLHAACVADNLNLEVIKELLRNGAKVNHINIDDYSALQLVFDKESLHLEVIRELLIRGAEVNRLNRDGLHPLHLTFRKQNASSHLMCEVLKELLSHGGDVNCQDRWDKFTPLHDACANRNINLAAIRELLFFGADVNALDYRNVSPLFCACGNENVNMEIVKELLKHGAHANQTDESYQSPLHAICDSSSVNLEVIKELLNHGAVANQHDRWGFTPFQYACLNSDTVVEYFLKSNLSCNGNNLEIIEDVIRKFCESDVSLKCLKLFIKYTALEAPYFVLDTIFQLSPRNAMDLFDYQDKCFAELSHLIEESMENSLSMYNFLLCDRISRNFFFRSSIIQRECFHKVLNILSLKKYPTYAEIVTSMIDRRTMINKLLNTHIYTFVDTNKSNHTDSAIVVLSFDCVNHITRYLTDNDILNLNVAFYEPSEI